MRSPRIIIVAAFSLTAVLLTYISLWPSQLSHTTKNPSTLSKAGILAFFTLKAPFSFFPPNAIITLTHDNTTAFLAKPAAFGPFLPKIGLKARVWIGNGFGDVASGGELGCSDVPGWEDRFAKSAPNIFDGAPNPDEKPARLPKFQFLRRARSTDGPYKNLPESLAYQPLTKPSADDGTDDYLHHPLPASKVSIPNQKSSLQINEDHADIQSLQEGAEISGKIVLLSRGGCGFLEKTKWAQRRGAVALIVGDDSKGGPLIQMYAKGDTSSVTIPSIFTSYTTAHLLCSLIGPGVFTGESNHKDGKPNLPSKKDKPIENPRKKISSPTFTSSTIIPVSTKALQKKKGDMDSSGGPPAINTERHGWLKSIFFGVGSLNSKFESSRPPSSGRLDWVLVDQWKDDEETKSKRLSSRPNQNSNPKKAAELKSNPPTNSKNRPVPEHDFVIGVQDWRDPDLVGATKISDIEPAGKASPTTRFTKDKTPDKNDTLQPPKKHPDRVLQPIPEYVAVGGGIVTPSSGEYTIQDSNRNQKKKSEDTTKERATEDNYKGLFKTIFGAGDNINFITPGIESPTTKDNYGAGEENKYEGLWITLTPSTGASPFFETLLVLVVSPLVTLTIVYALLLIRSRTRRRRWRAPKSVVARLPVRTYQSITSPGSHSPRLASPCSLSVTAPLLQSIPKPRPRSRTTTGLPEPSDFIRNSSPSQALASIPKKTEPEKNPSESSEWTKHMGKQVECVVCLEEYIDGVSRVMGLPCGHEFHVDCITPWLTTRRRTCPICKGDVVRSLAGGPCSSPQYEALRDDIADEENAQPLAIQTSINNSSPTIITNPRTTDDVELGMDSNSRHNLRITIADGLRGLLTNNFRSRSPDLRSTRQTQNQ